MKKIVVLVCCAVCFVIFSCHKDSKVIPQDFYFKANKGGTDWGAIVTTQKITPDSLRILAFRQPGEEQLYIDIKFDGVGTYTLSPGQARFFTTVGSDVITSDYRLNTDINSVLVINSYDAKNNIISGISTLYMLRNSADYFQLTFVDGTFRAKLPE